MHRLLTRQLRKLEIGDGPPTIEQWRAFLERVEAVYTDADRDRYNNERALDLSSAEMRQRFVELQETQRKLVEASRKAGMADVAASVLHNIGNVLNSVNTSTTVVAGLVKSSSRAGLGKCLALLQAQAAPGAFIDGDPKGKKVIPYLVALDKTLTEERDGMLAEVESLAKNIEHIKKIVTQQLSAAKGDAHATRMVETVDLGELLTDAMTVVASSLDPGRPIQFIREIGVPKMDTDRHKLFQIVMNLVTNARDALAERPSGTIKLVTRRVGEDRVSIEVSDDGCGIAKETLGRIFSHGFTTKANGHGFGLHASACAAIELGGSLKATSDGLGCGSTFHIELPGSPRASKRSNTVRLPTRRPEAPS